MTIQNCTIRADNGTQGSLFVLNTFDSELNLINCTISNITKGWSSLIDDTLNVQNPMMRKIIIKNSTLTNLTFDDNIINSESDNTFIVLDNVNVNLNFSKGSRSLF